MKAIVGNAKTVLEDFYKDNGLVLLQGLVQGPASAGEAGEAPPPPPKTWEDPYGGQKEESTSVIAILEMTMEDIEKDISHAKANEDEAETEYKEFKKDSEDTIKELGDAITDLESAKGEKEGKISDTAETRIDSKKELKATMKTIKGAEPGCDYLSINYPVRMKARQTETDGLLKAKAILQGGKFDETDPGRELKPGDAFLQKRRR